MASQLSDQINPRFEDYLRLQRCWAWFLALGVVIIIVGLVALSSAVASTLASVLVFGILLMIGGVVQIVNAFMARSWGGFFTHVLVGILHLVVGEMLFEHPLLAAEGLTLLLAAAFLVSGAIQIVHGLMEKFTGRGWVLLSGFVTLLLGISIWRQWPQSSLWVLGMSIGIDLVFSGWSWVMLGMTVKALGPAPAPSAAPAGAAH